MPEDLSAQAHALEKRAYRAQLKGNFFKAATKEAVDLYISAGNLWKAEGELDKAATCYMHGVDLLSAGPDAEDYSLEAGTIWLKLGNWRDAARALSIALEQCLLSRRPAAVIAHDLARAYRHEGDVLKAKDALEQASSLYFSDRKPLQGSKCMLEVGQLLARRSAKPLGFSEAAVAYNNAFGVMMANNQKIAPDLVLQQLFCALLSTETPGQPQAEGLLGPESIGMGKQWLDKMVYAVRANDEALFTEMLYQWDQRYPMGDTALALSLQVKRRFELNELL